MMTFITDGFSLTGTSHVPKGLGNQDATAHGVAGKTAYAIVCDGSSCANATTGEPDRSAKTGLGAAVLAQLTEQAILSQPGVDPCKPEIARAVINMTQQVGISNARTLLNLKAHDMLATCLYAIVSPEGGFVNILGDGVMAIRTAGGAIRAIKWSWGNNMPYYPAYRANGMLDSFVAKQGGEGAGSITVEEWALNGEPEHLESRTITVGEGVDGICIPFSADDVAGIESLVLFSDGICSVGKNSMNPKFQRWEAMVQRMFVRWGNAVPNFAMARLDRWQQRDCPALEASHLDDLSIAAIRRVVQ